MPNSAKKLNEIEKIVQFCVEKTISGRTPYGLDSQKRSAMIRRLRALARKAYRIPENIDGHKRFIKEFGCKP